MISRNAVLRSVVWLGAAAIVAYLKKPGGAGWLAVRTDITGWLGAGLLIAGLALHFWSNATLARGERASGGSFGVLVSDGPFRYVRNPIYLAAVPLLLGPCLLYSTVTIADLAMAFVLSLYFRAVVVRIEEPALRRRIGPSYDEYCRRVPRWIPRLPDPANRS
jgi:protein-S-isoprenylcysteine O-methyltransferase Ste14